MNVVSDVFAVIGFVLLVDWKVIPEWVFVNFVQHKHGNFYNKFDVFILEWARTNKTPYDSKKDANIKLLAFLFLLLSGVVSLTYDVFLLL